MQDHDEEEGARVDAKLLEGFAESFPNRPSFPLFRVSRPLGEYLWADCFREFLPVRSSCRGSCTRCSCRFGGETTFVRKVDHRQRKRNVRVEVNAKVSVFMAKDVQPRWGWGGPLQKLRTWRWSWTWQQAMNRAGRRRSNLEDKTRDSGQSVDCARAMQLAAPADVGPAQEPGPDSGLERNCRESRYSCGRSRSDRSRRALSG